MNKSFTLFVCFSGFLVLFQGAQAVSVSKKCSIEYEDAPLYFCAWVTGPDGKKHQECTDAGSAARAETLDKTHKTLKDPAWALNVLNFSGYCKCTLYLYSKENYKGYSLSYAFSKSKTKKIYPDKLWKRLTNSFKVVCAF